MESVLKENSRCDKIMVDQDGLGLIHVIWYITHKQDKMMHSTMTYVEALLEFATTYQDPNYSNTDSYALLKSIRDTVTAHGRQPGYHLKLYDEHWKILVVTEGVVYEQAINTEKKRNTHS